MRFDEGFLVFKKIS